MRHQNSRILYYAVDEKMTYCHDFEWIKKDSLDYLTTFCLTERCIMQYLNIFIVAGAIQIYNVINEIWNTKPQTSSIMPQMDKNILNDNVKC